MKRKKKKVEKKEEKALVIRPEMGLAESVLVLGDLSKMDENQRADYYLKVCKSLGLNPFTKPFGYINMNGKMTLYALKDCTEQLRKIHGVSVTALDGKVVDGLYIVTATGRDKNGKVDCATGAVSVLGVLSEAKANAIMKAETKAKRRLTLSICGLGMLDESEADSVPGAVVAADIAVNPGSVAKEATPEAKSAKVEKEKPIDEIVRAFPQDVKDLLKQAGFDTVKKAHDAYKKVEGDVDALRQWLKEGIKA